MSKKIKTEVDEVEEEERTLYDDITDIRFSVKYQNIINRVYIIVIGIMNLGMTILTYLFLS